MKKILIFTLIFIFLMNQAFSYNQTNEDTQILEKLKYKFEKMYKENSEKLDKIKIKSKEIQLLYKNKKRISYIFWEIYNIINIIIFSNTKNKENIIIKKKTYKDFKWDNIDDIFLKSKIDKDICFFSLWDLTKNLKKTTFIVSSSYQIKKAIDYSLTTDKWVEIIIKKGSYYLEQWFRLSGNNLIIRWETWDKDDIKLFWKWIESTVSNIFWVANKNIMIWDLTVWEVKNHPIQILWEKDADNFVLHNVSFVDSWEQMLKWTYNKSKSNIHLDNWLIQCSEFIYSAWIWPQYYIWWIDIHKWYNFLVQYNKFSYIKSPDKRVAEYAIHFWSNSYNIIIKNNIIEDCDRWIWFWLWESNFNSWSILNNEIYHDDTWGDVGIWLENASNILIKWNTIKFNNDYKNAIEYRFKWTFDVIITWNKINKLIKSRNGGEAKVYDNEILK